MMGAANHNLPPTDCRDWSKDGHVVPIGPVGAFSGISALGLDEG